jgi:hypothetical protein
VNVEISLVQVLVFGLVFDAVLLVVVVAHIRFVVGLNGQIMALEASTDLLLQSQQDLHVLIRTFLSKVS